VSSKGGGTCDGDFGQLIQIFNYSLKSYLITKLVRLNSIKYSHVCVVVTKVVFTCKCKHGHVSSIIYIREYVHRVHIIKLIESAFDHVIDQCQIIVTLNNSASVPQNSK